MGRYVDTMESLSVTKLKVSGYLNTIEVMLQSANEEIAQARARIDEFNGVGVETEGILDKYPDILTVEQMAELLHLTKGAVSQMAKEKRLPGTKIQEKWRFSKKAIIEWMYSRSLNNLLSEAEKVRKTRKAAGASSLYTVK